MTDNSALFQLGMDLDAPGTTRAEDYDNNNNVVPFARDEHAGDLPADHFIVKDGVACAGTHLIIDLVDADGLADVDLIDAAMRECVEEAGATLLHIHLHPFTPEGVAGVSGVAVLAESHISIHTWPERRFAALDVFMCGDAKPEKCVEVLRRRFNAGEVRVNELLRGSNL
ncbi:MAG: adenosylmethionine decarboxylase [Anderseniella sp.]|jgi:S-adenosylmethionine decarboxylase|nr:adenosylmethionine decarboxylase [Anderseniella sp.]